MEVYRRFRLPDGRLVERLVETLPVVAVVVGENYYQDYKPIAPQGNFENTFPSRRGTEIIAGGWQPRRHSRPRKGEEDRSWKWNRRTSWLWPKASFRKMAPKLAESEVESRALLANLNQEIMLSFDYY